MPISVNASGFSHAGGHAKRCGSWTMRRTSRSPGLILKASRRAAWTASISPISCSGVYGLRTSISTVGIAISSRQDSACRSADPVFARDDSAELHQQRDVVDHLQRAADDQRPAEIGLLQQ